MLNKVEVYDRDWYYKVGHNGPGQLMCISCGKDVWTSGHWFAAVGNQMSCDINGLKLSSFNGYSCARMAAPKAQEGIYYDPSFVKVAKQKCTCTIAKLLASGCRDHL